MAHRYDSRPSTPDGRPRRTFHSSNGRSREPSPASLSERSHVERSRSVTFNATHFGPELRPPHAPPERQYHSLIAQKGRPLRPFRKSSWPPYATVEDEKASLAKEAYPRRADADQVEVQSRGSIDQTPIILNADDLLHDPPANINTQARSGRARRDPHLHVDVGGVNKPPARASTYAAGTEINNSAAGDGSTQIVDFADQAPRNATPYSFTPKREPRPSPTDSGYSSSTDLLAEKRRKARAFHFNNLTMSDALRGQGKLRESHHVRRASGLSFGDDSAYEKNLEDGVPDKGPPKDRQPASQNAATRPRLSAIKADAVHSPRRSSDTATTLARSQAGTDQPSSPVASKTPPLATLAAKSTHEKVFDNQSETSSRPSSPISFTSSPPETPLHPERNLRYHPRNNNRWSGTHFSAGSKVGSRAASPEDLMRHEHMQRSSTFPNLQEHRPSQHPSRANFPYPPDRYERRDAYATNPPTPSSSLPYPMDDMPMMPSAEYYQNQASMQEGLSMPSAPMARRPPVGPPSPTTSHRSVHGSLASRPRLPSRRTANEVLPTLKTATRIYEEPLFASPTNVAASSLQTPCALPPCPRARSTREYDDWYILNGLTGFHICPDCLDNSFGSHGFGSYFRRAGSRDKHARTKCDFDDLWVRLAWHMTQYQRRQDLDLVYAIARIGVHDSGCPGDHDQTATWYTLVDRNGERVRHFDVCKTDVKRVEALMPELHDTFVKAYNETKVRKCDLRTQSHRCSKYLDELYKIVETAAAARRPPNVQAFVDFAKNTSSVPECRKDELLRDKPWHYIRELPEFTVCKECYTEVVWPEIERGSSLANRFSKTPQVLYASDRPQEDGVSCQLYSPRMRHTFKDACDAEDFDKLRNRIKARKRAELKYMAHERSAWKKLKQAEAGRSAREIKQARGEMEDIVDEWRRYE
ncbi:MAG: hypothetical protein Q9162_006845 [Coniocarpon cinnabarinum]